MANIFSRLLSGIKRLFTKESLYKIDAVLSEAEQIMPLAYQIAFTLAALTPTRTDDELIAAAQQITGGEFKVADLLRNHSSGDVLRAIAKFALQKHLRTDVKSNVLNLAIEAAVAALEGSKK